MLLNRDTKHSVEAIVLLMCNRVFFISHDWEVDCVEQQSTWEYDDQKQLQYSFLER